jgi:hypothetical protein
MCNLAHYNHALVVTSTMPLTSFISKSRSDSALMREYGQEGVRNFELILTQFALNMVGPVKRPTAMTGESISEEYFRSTFVSAEHRMLIGWLNTCCLTLAYYFGDYERADDYSRMTHDYAIAAAGHPSVYRHAMFSSLTAFAMARRSGDRLRRMGQWRRALLFAKQVQTWADAGNVNCVHVTQLLEAERLSFSKRSEIEAKRMYNAAITTALKNGYLNDKALAHERAFLFYLKLAAAGRKPPSSSPNDGMCSSDVGDDWFWAQHHYTDAVEAYCDWNAFQKARHLVDTYGGQFPSTGSAFWFLESQALTSRRSFTQKDWHISE